MVSRSLPFIKAQGLGNDFVMLLNPDINEIELSTVCQNLANRRYGIGCDQVILAMDSADGIINIRFFNSDGSEAESCGNGSRCIAKYIMIQKQIFSIELQTLGGCIHCNLSPEEMVEIEMPKPQIQFFNELELVGFTSSIVPTSVDVGNPHLICFVDDIAISHRQGQYLEHHPFFPRKTNVGFVNILSRNHIELMVWERGGSGVTPACGSGACAAMVAACRHQLVENKDVIVSQPGGDLRISWVHTTQDGGITPRLLMTGPAEIVFTGDYMLKSSTETELTPN